MSNIEKQARKDAEEYARAQMYYGEGAGIRRRLITATVEQKCEHSSEYQRAFERELDRQDMVEHAKAARKERKRRDRTEAVTKNTKALATGNYQNVQGTIMILAAGAWMAHQAGLDKVVYKKGKEVYAGLKLHYRRRKTALKVLRDNDPTR